jgi:hypothetical protein
LQLFFKLLIIVINWIENPFEEESFQTAALSIREKDKLIELLTDSALKAELKENLPINF